MIANLIALGLLAITLGTFLLVMLRAWDKRREEKIWDALALSGKDETFTHEMVANLPEPAQRYLLHAIAPGTPLARSVKLDLRGTIRLDRQGEWLQMACEEVVAPPEGFLWRAHIKGRKASYFGADALAEGVARIRFWLWDVLPIVRARGGDIARSEAGRLALEAMWMPAALLPQRGTTWTPVGDDSATAHLAIGEESVDLTFHVGPEGQLHKISLMRWGPDAKGVYTYRPFTGWIVKERAFGGYTIPVQVRASWGDGGVDSFEFYRADVETAAFA